MRFEPHPPARWASPFTLSPTPMQHTLKEYITETLALVVDLYDATATGDSVDLAGYGSATVLVVAGTKTDGTHLPSLEESDDDDTYTPVISGDLLGTFAGIASDTIQEVAYRGEKRFIRPIVTVSGTPTTGAVYGVMIVRGHARYNA